MYKLNKPILIIGGWSSHCGKCGKDCDFEEKKHNTILGYGSENGSKGCGVKWEKVTSDCCGKDRLKELRPDLEFIALLDIFNK